jgi:C4-type Zn-finger protein
MKTPPDIPQKRARADLTDGVPCPFCSHHDTELVTPFGGQLSVAQYWCRKCRTGFDYLKWNAKQ